MAARKYRHVANVVLHHGVGYYDNINRALEEFGATVRLGPALKGYEICPMPDFRRPDLIGLYKRKGNGMTLDDSTKLLRQMCGLPETS